MGRKEQRIQKKPEKNPIRELNKIGYQGLKSE